MDKSQMRFEEGEVGFRRGGRGPEDGVIVGKRGEEDAEEEGCRC